MKKYGYQALGFGIWQTTKWFMRGRFGAAPRRIAVGGLFVAVLAALVLAGRKASAD